MSSKQGIWPTRPVFTIGLRYRPTSEFSLTYPTVTELIDSFAPDREAEMEAAVTLLLKDYIVAESELVLIVPGQ
jgi:hypothetical protein